MSRPKIGDRVGCWHKITESVFSFFGTGTYVDDVIPTKASGINAPRYVSGGESNELIKLDTGEDIYGCECYWSDEEYYLKLKDELGKRGMDLEEVTIDEVREWCATQEVSMEEVHKRVSEQVTKAVAEANATKP